MPRIRSFKPEWRQHPIRGRFSDRVDRLWRGMIVEADDEGRLVCHPAQLRVLIWGYHPDVTDEDVEAAILELEASGEIRLYEVKGVRYADLPTWREDQTISHPSKSKLPSYLSALVDVAPTDTAGKPGDGPAPWGTPLALVELYNDETADECPAVIAVSPARLEKARQYLAMFPERDWWVWAFQATKRSRLLRGLVKSPGHEHFIGSLDWFLQRGKNDGVENCVKAYEGKYDD